MIGLKFNKLLFLLVLVLACLKLAPPLAQSDPINKTPKKKIFSFGEYWYLNVDHKMRDGNLDYVNTKYATEGIVYGDSIFYQRNASVKSDLLIKLIKASDIKSVFFINSDMDFIWIDNTSINKELHFWQCKFPKPILLMKNKFTEGVYFNGSDFLSPHSIIDSISFEGYTSFFGANFKEYTSFQDINADYVDFKNSVFSERTYFSKCNFNNSSFKYSKFEKMVSFTNCILGHNSDFEGVQFYDDVQVLKVKLEDTLNLFGSTMVKGIDFRRTSLDSVSTIILEDFEYPNGKLQFYWSQFMGIEKPKIQLKSYTEDKEDDYKKIEQIYLRLRDNFISLGDKSSADDIMYELAWQKEIIIENFVQRLYGITLGYGYKPWRFLLFIILPLIILFSIIYYYFYFGIVIRIVNPNIESDLVLPKIASLKIPVSTRYYFKRQLKYYDHSSISPRINILTKIWYTIHFSTSVLLGVRFKKEWIKAVPQNILGNKTFMFLVTFEWILGISLYIIFISYVFSSQFNNVKGILGF